MKTIFKPVLIALALTVLWSMDFSPDAPFEPVFVGDAQAIVGRPLTPVSVGGVARRTTRRAVVASSSTSSAEAAAAQQQASQAEADAAAAQQQAAQAQADAAAAQQQAAATRLPAGTVVTALPSGCESITVDGVSMFNCGGVMYQPQFQSNNLVYVVK